MKKFAQFALVISFLFSFIVALLFVNFGAEIEEIMDHPLASSKLSLLDKTLLVNYTTVLFFPILLPGVIILLSIFLFVVSSLKAKNTFYESVWLFGMLAAIHFVSFLCLQLLHSRFLSNLLLVPFYFVLPITILIKYREAYLKQEMKKLILFMCAMFAAVCISANNTKFVPSLTKEVIELTVIVLITVGLLTILSYNFVSKPLSGLYQKARWLKNARAIRLIFNFLIALVLLSIIISSCGFLWESQKTTVRYKDIGSNTKADINVLLIIIDKTRLVT